MFLDELELDFFVEVAAFAPVEGGDRSGVVRGGRTETGFVLV